VDLFLGRITRAHKDFDISIFRNDSVDVIATLPGREFFESKGDRSPKQGRKIDLGEQRTAEHEKAKR
jgi:hypothetical protein